MEQNETVMVFGVGVGVPRDAVSTPAYADPEHMKEITEHRFYFSTNNTRVLHRSVQSNTHFFSRKSYVQVERCGALNEHEKCETVLLALTPRPTKWGGRTCMRYLSVSRSQLVNLFLIAQNIDEYFVGVCSVRGHDLLTTPTKFK